MSKQPLTANFDAPRSIEAEEATLGGILTNPDMFVLVHEFLSTDDFFLTRHRAIWRAIERIYERNEPTFDVLTVSEELKTVNYLDEIGGIPYLMRLVNNTPSSVNTQVYAQLVLRASQRRQLLQATEDIKALALDQELDIEHVMEGAEARLQNVTLKAAQRTEQHIRQVMGDVFDEFEQRRDKQGQFYLPTGMRAIDQFSSGLERGCIHIVGGKPGMGKSSLCLGIAIGSARFGVHVLYISNEMENKRMGMRIAAMEAGVNLQALKRGEVTPDETDRFIEAVGRLSKLPLHMDYIPETTVTQVHAKILRLQREFGLDAVIIDGLWRMQAPEFRGDSANRNSINGYLTNALVRIAKETNVAMVVTHQLTKSIDNRQDKRPTKGDLEYGGQIDQNADVIALIYRDEVYNEATEYPGAAEIIFDKNRDAPTGTVTMYFDKKTTRFLDASPVNIDLRSEARNPIYINGEEVER